MRILHVTPHLPPDQAANALLPWQLGNWARAAGDTVEYAAHPSRAGGRAELAGGVTWLPRRSGGFFDRTLRLGSIAGAWRIQRALGPLIGRADVVHVHSNGLLAEVAVLAAVRAKKPVVLTLYGSLVPFHFQPRPLGQVVSAFGQIAYLNGWDVEALDVTTYRGIVGPAHADALGLPVGTVVEEPAWLARVRRR